MSRVEDLCRSYLDLRWHFDPGAATAAGVHGHDGHLGSFDHRTVREHLAALKSVAGAVEELDVADTQEEIDRTALLDEIRITVLRLEKEAPHVRDPGFWLGHLLQAHHALLISRDRPPKARAPAALERLEATPALLAAAQQTLKSPPQVFLDTARAMARGGDALLASVVREFGAASPALAERLREAGARARTALADFAAALGEEIRPDPDPLAFAIGEEQFNRHLHHEHALASTAPELWRYGLHLVNEVQAEVMELARRVDPTVSWRDVMERLRETQDDPGDLLQAYRAEMERARRWVVENDLMTVPEGPLEVLPTPDFLRPVLPVAAYEPPGVYAADRTGRFYVTDPAPGLHPEARRDALRGHALHGLAVTALHEAYPGHHLQILTAQSHASEVRRNLWSPVTVEGWALYCEELMREQGYYRTAEQQLFQRTHLLWRAVRVLLDVGLHTRGMSPEEGVTMLLEHVPLERAQAEAEIRRYCATPTYQLSYAVGRKEILQLREDYRAREGAAFSLKRFHDEFLTYGGLPVSLIRWGMDLGIEE